VAYQHGNVYLELIAEKSDLVGKQLGHLGLFGSRENLSIMTAVLSVGRFGAGELKTFGQRQLRSDRVQFFVKPLVSAYSLDRDSSVYRVQIESLLFER